jgi:hypothetical protein
MQQSVLEVGRCYTNGKKRETIRKILGFPACHGDWMEAICVHYLVIKGLSSEVGKAYTITQRSFARWAHREVQVMWPHSSTCKQTHREEWG